MRKSFGATTTSLVFLTHPAPMTHCYLERWSKTHHFAGTQKLHEMIQQPYDLFKPGWADQYVVGMINQVAQAMDDFITSQVSHTITLYSHNRALGNQSGIGASSENDGLKWRNHSASRIIFLPLHPSSTCFHIKTFSSRACLLPSGNLYLGSVFWESCQVNI
jgi:hypothetical protein